MWALVESFVFGIILVGLTLRCQKAHVAITVILYYILFQRITLFGTNNAIYYLNKWRLCRWQETDEL